MKIFITGITGYLGSKLAVSLVNDGHIVHALVRDLDSDKIPEHVNIKPFRGELQNLESIKRAMKDCEVVLHLAGYTNLRCKNIEPFYEVNVTGTSNVLKVAHQLEVNKLIYTSSVSVFGPSFPGCPITEDQPRITSYNNDYELTKVLAENLVKDYNRKGLPGIILNISRIYGPGVDSYSNGINKLFHMIFKNKFLVVPSRLKALANYVYIEDVVYAIKLALRNAKVGEQFIIGGENADFERLFSLMFAMAGLQKKVFKVNYQFLKQVSRITSLVNLFSDYDHSFCPRLIDFLFTDRAVSSEKAKKELGYRYTSLEEGLENTIQFIKNNSRMFFLFQISYNALRTKRCRNF